MVTLEFIGNTQGAQIFRHPVTKRQIRAGRNLAVRFVNVDESEVDYFISLTLFRVAHMGAPITTNVKRREEPRRIVPIENVSESTTTSNELIEDTTNVVSFDESEETSIIDWMSESSQDLVVDNPSIDNESDNSDLEVNAESEKSEKPKRGRQVRN